MNALVCACLGGIIGIFAVVRFASGAPIEVMAQTFLIGFLAMFFVGLFVSALIGYFFSK